MIIESTCKPMYICSVKLDEVDIESMKEAWNKPGEIILYRNTNKIKKIKKYNYNPSLIVRKRR